MIEVNGDTALVSGLVKDPLFVGMACDPLVSVAIIDMEGRMVYTNPQWDRLQMAAHKVQYDTLAGHRVDEILPQDQAKEHTDLAKAVAATGKPCMIRKCCGGRMYAVWTYPVVAPSRFSATDPVFLFVVRPEIIDEDMLELCGDQIAPTVRFKHNDLGPLAVLTSRELEILGMIARGMSTKAIATALHRSVKTVESHRTSIGAKLKVDDRVHLAEIARRAGLTTRGMSDSRFDLPPNQ